MKDIAIAIEVGSPNSTVELVKRTFESIRNNIGLCDWKVFISIGLNIPHEVGIFVKSFVSRNNDHFEIFQEDEVSWANFINQAIELSEDYKYFIKSHDDIELITSNFYLEVTSALKKINKPVGWVSFTDIGWKYGDFGTPTRPGYYKDYMNRTHWLKRQVFQFHLFPEYWTRNIYPIHIFHKIRAKINILFGYSAPDYPKPIKRIKRFKVDLPSAPVKCHAPYNHFVLIERSVLDKIGKCEDWGTKMPVLLDEDWGLRALELGFPNIWISDIEYFHHRPEHEGGGTRCSKYMRDVQEHVHEEFYLKWGFHHRPSTEELIHIKEKHRNNLIPWSSYRNSFEWDYEI